MGKAITIQDLGSVGEFVAAIATLATLAYLAIQVKQNTKSLRASTFQQVSEAMAMNASYVTDNGELAAIALKAATGGDLIPVEGVRYRGLLLMSIRRLESVYLHHQLGSIDSDQVKGFELSMLSILKVPLGVEWWKDAKITFHHGFVEHIDKRLMRDDIPDVHPSLLRSEN